MSCEAVCVPGRFVTRAACPRCSNNSESSNACRSLRLRKLNIGEGPVRQLFRIFGHVKPFGGVACSAWLS